MIATPMYGGMCCGEYTRAMLDVIPTLHASGVDVSTAFIYNNSLITSARNQLANMFLKHDFTHLMFIDADIVFQARDIVSMLEADKDVIAGIYPKKRFDWSRVEMAVKAGVPTNELQNHMGDLVVHLVEGKKEQVVKYMEPAEVYGAGTGFMLIKREVFETLRDKVDTYKEEDGTDTLEYFYLKKDPATGRQLSEDYAFCWLCRDNGVKIHVAPWVRLGHVGTHQFNGSVIPVTN